MDKIYIATEEDGTCWSDDALVCPHCKNIQGDLFELSGAYTEGEHETDCGSCSKQFSFYTSVSFAWTTRKLEASHE